MAFLKYSNLSSDSERHSFWENSTVYPCVGKSAYSTIVVRFTSFGTGKVLESGNRSSYRIGYHSDQWNMGRFTPTSLHFHTQNHSLREIMASPVASPEG